MAKTYVLSGESKIEIGNYTGDLYENSRYYTSREYDRETNLYYYRARYYSTELGRFISRDPIDVEDDINLYGYVGNNPTNFTDPLGKEKVLILRQTSGDYVIDYFVNYYLNLYKNAVVENFETVEDINRLFKKYDNIKHVEIVAHGSQRNLGKIKKFDGLKKAPDSINYIRLNSCRTGDGEDNIAKEFFKKLETNGEAPTDFMVKDQITGKPVLLNSTFGGSTIQIVLDTYQYYRYGITPTLWDSKMKKFLYKKNK